MAGKNVEEVRVAVDGVVSTGAFGVAVAPTSEVSVLGVTWSDLGYVSDAGVTETTEQTVTQLRAWQKAKVVRTLIEDGTVRYALQLIQTSAETVALYYGATVDTEDGSIVIDPTAERPRIALVLDIIDGDERIRAYAPEAQVVEVGDQVYSNGEPIGYEVTIECSYNETLGGSVKKWYSALVEA